MLVLVILSAVFLFGFLAYNIAKYGLQSCISAYSYYWNTKPLNLWSVSIIMSALLLTPVLLELSEGNVLQFVGFFAPVSMCFVGLTPRWYTNKTEHILHNVGVILAIIFILLFSITHNIWWIILIYMAAAGILTWINKDKVVMWFELAMYISVYTILVILLC